MRLRAHPLGSRVFGGGTDLRHTDDNRRSPVCLWQPEKQLFTSQLILLYVQLRKMSFPGETKP